MQIRTTMRYGLNTYQNDLLNRQQIIIVSEDVNEREFLWVVCGKVNCITKRENIMMVPQKIQNGTTIWSRNFHVWVFIWQKWKH